MIDIRENFLPRTFANNLLAEINSFNFPWYFLENSVYVPDPKKEKRSLFTHTLYSDEPTSSYFKFFLPVLYFIEDRFNVEVKEINRIKINFTQKTERPILHQPHIDSIDKDYTSFIYYFNTTDGSTNLYEELKNSSSPESYNDDSSLTLCNQITPMFNSIVRFESNRYHSSFTPVENDKRYILNMVLKLK
jgi:hypothetical protein